jgi:hypothetical protein
VSPLRRSVSVLWTTVLAGGLLAGCQAAPRQRPIELGPVAKGAGSLEAVRKQLEGTWTLVSFETYPAQGKAVPVQATGRLTYDQYGNLSLTGTLASPASGSAPDPSRYLNLGGRAVIDTASQRMWIVERETDPGSGNALPPPVSADKVRYYEFSGDLLTTSVKDANGRVTARLVWKRAE